MKYIGFIMFTIVCRSLEMLVPFTYCWLKLVKCRALVVEFPNSTTSAVEEVFTTREVDRSKNESKAGTLFARPM